MCAQAIIQIFCGVNRLSALNQNYPKVSNCTETQPSLQKFHTTTTTHPHPRHRHRHLHRHLIIIIFHIPSMEPPIPASAAQAAEDSSQYRMSQQQQQQPIVIEPDTHHDNNGNDNNNNGRINNNIRASSGNVNRTGPTNTSRSSSTAGNTSMLMRMYF